MVASRCAKVVAGAGSVRIIGRYIYGLDGSNGTIFRGSDPLLQFAQISSQCRLVSYCGRHTSKQCRYLGTGLDKTENVINEQQYILVLHITENTLPW